MLGVRPQLLPISAGVLDLYRVVISCLRERSHLAATARGVFNPHLIGDQPIAQGAAADASERSAELAARLYSRLRPVPAISSFVLSPTDHPRPTATLPAVGFCADTLHRALSPPSPALSRAVPSSLQPCLP
jgi:hypothetical protein